MLTAAIVAILVTMFLALIRTFIGPTEYDRMLAANSFGTKTVLLIALGGHALSWNSFLDVALLYALVNFVGTIAVMRFFEYSNASEKRDDPGDGSMTVILEWLSGLCLLLGGALCISGGVGLLRMPDFFSRVHASGVTETLAAPLLLSGLLLQMELSLDSVKVIMIMILVLATNPTATHAMAKATLHGGQHPLESANGKDIGGDGSSKP